ncbi:MAG TPA: Sec-independent protein translocase protein TatB [Burkholderiales bacterium]|nr:Sec-independent protein translocase protein TatB [Burkholderiales bacterium]
MFDVGFSELMVIAVVALIVIGPERLPRVARTMGHLFGRLQRYVNDVKADISREMELEELRKFRSTVEDAARGFESTVNTTVSSVQSEVAKTESELSATVSSVESEVAKTESELSALVPLGEPPQTSPEAAGPGPIGERGATPQLEPGLESKSGPAAPQQRENPAA